MTKKQAQESSFDNKIKVLSEALTLLSERALTEKIQETIDDLSRFEGDSQTGIDSQKARRIVMGSKAPKAHVRTKEVQQGGRLFEVVENNEPVQIKPKKDVLNEIVDCLPNSHKKQNDESEDFNENNMLKSIIDLLLKDKEQPLKSRLPHLKEKGIIPLWEQLSVHRRKGRIDNIEKALLLSDIRRGLEEKEFLYFYQPQWDLATGTLACLEGRLRWKHPSKGVLGPDFFLTLFEESNLLPDLLNLLFEQLLTDMAQMALNGINNIKVAVNFTPEQLELKYLAESLLLLLEKMNIDPARIECEITDRQFPHQPSLLRENLTRLKANGVALCLDNFGAGYSAYPYLQEFSFNKIKLDKSYVAHLFHNPNEQLIVRSVVHQAHLFGAKAVVGGLNSGHMLKWLQGIGCDFGQGCYTGMPKPLEETIDFLKEYNTIKDGKIESVESLWRAIGRPDLADDGSCVEK